MFIQNPLSIFIRAYFNDNAIGNTIDFKSMSIDKTNARMLVGMTKVMISNLKT